MIRGGIPAIAGHQGGKRKARRGRSSRPVRHSPSPPQYLLPVTILGVTYRNKRSALLLTPYWQQVRIY
jgi:hypothetical protein